MYALGHGVISDLEVDGRPGPLTAADVFVGYLAFDAWIGNQDRHHENWALLVSHDDVRLAPSFDHASSLGRNETDESRHQRLTTRDSRRTVAHYVTRARSALYGAKSDSRPLTTLEAFSKAAAFAPDAARFWLRRLGSISDVDVLGVFEPFSAEWMSDVAKSFAIEMLKENRKRLLTLIEVLE
jgi:hypothetical protein